jgi:hypothetical protein
MWPNGFAGIMPALRFASGSVFEKVLGGGCEDELITRAVCHACLGREWAHMGRLRWLGADFSALPHFHFTATNRSKRNASLSRSGRFFARLG